MSLVFSLVMFLTVAANKRSLEHDIPGERAGLYYVMMNLLFSSLLALIYTNDLLPLIFIEINTISACAIVCAKESGETGGGSHTLSHHEPGGKRAHPYLHCPFILPDRPSPYGTHGRAVRELASSGKDLFPLRWLW